MANIYEEEYYKYTIAGLSVTVNREIPDLDSTGYADGCLNVSIQSTVCGDNYSNFVAKSDPGRLPIHLSKDGKEILISEDNLKSLSTLLDEVRRALPYASYLQNKAILHASAVNLKGRVLAFVGESGAGKSTLAEEFSRHGFPLISDDLLACRIIDNKIVVPDIVNNDSTMLPLEAIYFLSRRKKLNNISIVPISKSESLRLLLYNGFGDLDNSSLWEYQYKFYLKVVNTILSFLLEIPDDLTLLKDTAVEIQKHFNIKNSL